MNRLFSFISSYGFPALLILVFLEYACFPVSSEIVLPFCGAFAAGKGIPFPFLVLLTSLAGLLGTLLCYCIGYFGGNRALNAIIRRFPKTRQKIRYSVEYFEKHGSTIVLVGRFIPLCRTYLGFVAGAARLPLITYIAYSFLGIFIWNSLLSGLGFLLKSRWPLVASFYTRYKNILIPVCLLAIIFLLLRKAKKGGSKPDEISC